MSKKIGYAVVGLGVGQNHAKAAHNSKNAQLVAVCDLIQEKLDSVKKFAPEVQTYIEYDEMLKNDDIDIISICLPSAMHAEFSIKAMEAGKNVLIEKPIDITVEAAEAIEEARIRTGMKAGVVHQNRNNTNIKPIYDAIWGGKIGKVILGDFAVKWHRSQEYYDNGGWRGTWSMDGGGSLMNQAVHTVDLMQWLMGDVESVTSHMGIYNHDIETEDLTMSIVKFKSGAVANFISSTCIFNPHTGTAIRVYGSNGSIEADSDELQTWQFMDADENEEKEMLEKYSGNGTAVSNDPSLCLGHASMVENMISAVMNDHDPQIMPLEAIKSVRIVNAIYESAKTGKTVTF